MNRQVYPLRLVAHCQIQLRTKLASHYRCFYIALNHLNVKNIAKQFLSLSIYNFQLLMLMFYWTLPVWLRRKTSERKRYFCLRKFAMIQVFHKIIKISSINNFYRTMRWKEQTLSAFRTIHTSRGKNHLRNWRNKVFKSKFLSALNHGDYEWQDPKSEHEM